MDKIDLDAIINQYDGHTDGYKDTQFLKRTVRECMKEAIHQALLLVKKKGRVIVHPDTEVDEMRHAKQYIDYMIIDEKSIDNMEKLIV